MNLCANVPDPSRKTRDGKNAGRIGRYKTGLPSDHSAGSHLLDARTGLNPCWKSGRMHVAF
jgi:hypothetical protein